MGEAVRRHADLTRSSAELLGAAERMEGGGEREKPRLWRRKCHLRELGRRSPGGGGVQKRPGLWGSRRRGIGLLLMQKETVPGRGLGLVTCVRCRV